MLAIRMQRTGRKGHAMFRVVVQEARLTPTSGKVVVNLGHYDPHAKSVTLDKEKASFYLEHGAQPSETVARLLKREGVKLPDWVTLSENKQRTVRHADKRRSTRPAEAVVAEPVADAPAEVEAPVEAEATESVAETPEALVETTEVVVETETAPVEEVEAPEAEAETPADEAETAPKADKA